MKLKCTKSPEDYLYTEGNVYEIVKFIDKDTIKLEDNSSSDHTWDIAKLNDPEHHTNFTIA